MANITHKFKLGSVPMEVHRENQEGFKWRTFYDRGKIIIMDTYAQKAVTPQNYNKYMWEAIHLIIMDKILYANSIDPIFDTHQAAQQVLVSQVMSQMWHYRNMRSYDGWRLQIAGAFVTVKVDDVVTEAAGQYAHYQGNHEEIVISTKHRDGELYSHEFIIQTIIHELLHCVNLQLGQQQGAWDKEYVVNTIASFLSEALLSMEEGDSFEAEKDYKIFNKYPSIVIKEPEIALLNGQMTTT